MSAQLNLQTCETGFYYYIFAAKKTRKTMSTTIEVLHKDRLLKITPTPTTIDFSLIYLSQTPRKFTHSLALQQTLPLSSHFESPQNFLTFMASQENYEISFEDFEVVILLKWEIVAFDFRKKMEYRVLLDELVLSEKERLECEVLILRKKLVQAQQEKVGKEKKERMDHDEEKKNKKPAERPINQSRMVSQEEQKIDNDGEEEREEQSEREEFGEQQDEGQQEEEEAEEAEQQEQHNESQRPERNQQNQTKRRPRRNRGSILTKKKKRPSIPKKKPAQQRIAQKKQNPNPESTQKRKRGRPFKNPQTKTKQISKAPKSPKAPREHSPSPSPPVSPSPTPSHSHREPTTTKKPSIPHTKKYINGQNIISVGDKIRIDYPNGDFYFGEMKDNLYHGQGYYSSKTSGVYEGEWKEGLKDGYGKFQDPDQNKYEGYFVKGYRHGKGKEIYSNSECYEGDFIKDQKEGHGTYHFINGDKYQGEWKDDKCHGKGKETFADGSVIVGMWKNDQRHGQCLYTKKNKAAVQIWSQGVLQSQEIVHGQLDDD